MPLEVIGAGFGRTGTLSMKAALEELGHRPCYHFVEVIEPRKDHNEGHRKAWVDFEKRRRPMDWEWLFRSYSACLDLPMCLYYKDLMQVFPNAKVVLTVRDPDAWFDSFSMLARILRRMRLAALVSPKLRASCTIANRVNERLFGGPPIDRKTCIAVFERHNQEVREFVPPDRLLVFEVTEGWDPLCEFLERPIPEIPFPRLNEGEALASRIVQSHLFGRKNVFSTDRPE